MDGTIDKPILKTRLMSKLQDVAEVGDGDINTCVTFVADSDATIMMPILDPQHDSVTVKTLTSYDTACPSYKDKDVFAVVKIIPPFRPSLNGVFRKCESISKYVESTLNAHVFNCTCDYGACEDYYVKIVSHCQVSVCSIGMI